MMCEICHVLSNLSGIKYLNIFCMSPQAYSTTHAKFIVSVERLKYVKQLVWIGNGIHWALMYHRESVQSSTILLTISIFKNESKSRSNTEENVQRGSASYHTSIDVCSTPSPLIKVERHSAGPLPVVLHTQKIGTEPHWPELPLHHLAY